MATFVAAASELLPALADDFGHLAERVDSQVNACGPDARRELLASHR